MAKMTKEKKLRGAFGRIRRLTRANRLLRLEVENELKARVVLQKQVDAALGGLGGLADLLWASKATLLVEVCENCKKTLTFVPAEA